MTAFDTAWPADSVEFCPHPDAHDVFVCGTYKLEQGEDAGRDEDDRKPRVQVRRGKCMLFAVEEDGEEYRMNNIQEVELPAVLDMKWCHRSLAEPPLLGVADSEGGISLYTYGIEDKRLTQIQSIKCASTDVLCLSLDWSNRRLPNAPGNLAVSLSNGSISILRPTDDGTLSISETWHAHDYEPWITAWNYWDANVLYSGGDDLKMKGWDLRQSPTQPIFTNKRFDAGVTSIQSHPFIEHLLAVGSYDNTVRLFDARKPLVPLTQADVGGGAWRVKWHPSPARKNDLLVACMHDGCKVVRFDLNAQAEDVSIGDHEVISRFDKHESMAYGADWSFSNNNVGDTLIASCSFYDHVLHTWKG